MLKIVKWEEQAKLSKRSKINRSNILTFVYKYMYNSRLYLGQIMTWSVDHTSLRLLKAKFAKVLWNMYRGSILWFVGMIYVLYMERWKEEMGLILYF